MYTVFSQNLTCVCLAGNECFLVVVCNKGHWEVAQLFLLLVSAVESSERYHHHSATFPGEIACRQLFSHEVGKKLQIPCCVGTTYLQYDTVMRSTQTLVKKRAFELS